MLAARKLGQLGRMGWGSEHHGHRGRRLGRVRAARRGIIPMHGQLAAEEFADAQDKLATASKGRHVQMQKILLFKAKENAAMDLLVYQLLSKLLWEPQGLNSPASDIFRGPPLNIARQSLQNLRRDWVYTASIGRIASSAPRSHAMR